uniref:Ig-like domain-containing protein n=1 Tax=Ursus americanus TaxID=9643 RepID=A0A452RQZ7_URSAM
MTLFPNKAPFCGAGATGREYEDNHVVLACLAKGPSLKSVQITLKLEGQDQIQETKLIILDRRHTQLSLLVTPQEPGPYHCNAVSWSPSHHMEKPIQWPGGRPPDPRGWPAGSPAPATQRTRTRPAPGPLKSCPHRPYCWNHTHPPSLYVLRPPLRGPWLQGEASFTCLAVGDDLQEARLSWEVAGAPPSGAVEEGSLEEHVNGSQSLSSRLSLPVSLWASGASIACALSRPSRPPQLASAVPREHAATAPSSLAVRVLTVPPAASWLLCEVSGFSPPDILLTWLRGHAEVDATGFGTAPPMPQPGNTTFQTWSVLRVLAAQGPLPATYTCVVRHDASRKALHPNPLDATCPGPPVTVHGPRVCSPAPTVVSWPCFSSLPWTP